MKKYISYEMYTVYIYILNINISYILPSLMVPKNPTQKMYVVESYTKVRGANLWLRKV